VATSDGACEDAVRYADGVTMVAVKATAALDGRLTMPHGDRKGRHSC